MFILTVWLMPHDSYSFLLMAIIQIRQCKKNLAFAMLIACFSLFVVFQSKFDKSAIND